MWVMGKILDTEGSAEGMVCRATFFWMARVCLPLLCLCRPMISKVYLNLNSECCAVASGALPTYTVVPPMLSHLSYLLSHLQYFL